MTILTKSVWKPYIGDRKKSCQLLNDFDCHKQKYFRENMQPIGTSVKTVSERYICVFQSCHVDVIKLLKHRIRNYDMYWASREYT